MPHADPIEPDKNCDRPLVSRAVNHDGATALPTEHRTVGFRVRDVTQAPAGAPWLLDRADRIRFHAGPRVHNDAITLS